MVYKFSALILTLLLLASPGLTQAQSDARFQRVGTLDDLHVEQRVVVVNDVPYSLSNDAVVRTSSAATIPLSRLRVGSKVGYKLSSSGRLITEIWVLPRNYKSPGRS